MIVLIAFGLMGATFVYRLINSPGHPIDGIVESVTPLGVTNAPAPGPGIVSVRLNDGAIVIAEVPKGKRFQVGDEVRVMEQTAAGAGQAYEVIARAHGTGP